MAENEKYVDGLTEAESEDMAIIVNKTINEICLFSDKHNIDRDSMLKYFADMLTAFTEVASIQNYETNHTCNCKHNSNSRDNEPCCRCDSRKENANMVKVNGLEIIVRMIENKPYYELKYRQVGEKDYSIGYSSYDLKIVLGYIDTYFEIVESDSRTNADRIRNMSDEELAEFIEQISTDSMETISFGTKEYKEIWERKETALEWLQSEAE